MSLGLIMGGFDVRVAVDNDDCANMTYWLNLCGKDSIWVGPKPKLKKNDSWDINHHSGSSGKNVKVLISLPIQEVSGEMIRKAGNIGKEEITLLAGGPPCQGFSTSNPKRCVTDPRSQLMWQFVKKVGELKPLHFAIENVPGMLSYKDFVFILMESLEKHKYVVRVNMLNAAGYGVPQNRIRVFIHGVREDQKKLPVYPVPTHFSKELLERDNIGMQKAEIAKRAFAQHGFPKEELKELYFNRKLNIYMNKKKAADTVLNAFRAALIEGVTGKRIKDMTWFRLKLPEIKQKKIGEYL
jgi:site-specific DNA-cytosine methylase